MTPNDVRSEEENLGIVHGLTLIPAWPLARKALEREDDDRVSISYLDHCSSLSNCTSSANPSSTWALASFSGRAHGSRGWPP
jgi:hypothetical protein